MLLEMTLLFHVSFTFSNFPFPAFSKISDIIAIFDEKILRAFNFFLQIFLKNICLKSEREITEILFFLNLRARTISRGTLANHLMLSNISDCSIRLMKID